MKVSKESLKTSLTDKDNANMKFPAKASGANLAEGVSHSAKAGDVDGMYSPTEGTQRMPKGSDRI